MKYIIERQLKHNNIFMFIKEKEEKSNEDRIITEFDNFGDANQFFYDQTEKYSTKNEVTK